MAMKFHAEQIPFFLSCALGLEQALARECEEVQHLLLGKDARPHGAELIFSIEKGGISFAAPLVVGIQMAFWSKLATRLLVRIGVFSKITEFSHLKGALNQVEWEDWQVEPPCTELQVSCRASKWGHEGKVKEEIQRFLHRRFGRPPTTLFFRLEHDELTVSVDVFHDRLMHRSQTRPLGGRAPLRETLAAFVVRELLTGQPLAATQQKLLFDPMMGSGTLLAEASRIYQPEVWELRPFKACPKLLMSPTFWKNYSEPFPQPYLQCLGWDIDAEQRELAKNWLREPAAKIQEARHDVITNPPYGERLPAIPPKSLAQLLVSSQPERVAVILPLQAMSALISELKEHGYSPLRSCQVSNGGIPCRVVVFELCQAPK